MSNTSTLNGGGDELLYPPIEPFSEQVLPVSAVHKLHFEQSGNPSGFPVVFLHGGPGSQTRPEHRRYFDPRFYRILLFDQRGCGRSSPAGSTEENTTWHLVQDMETMRRNLGIETWLVFGGSWGSTLALAYATNHPERVAGMILRGIFLASRAELDWYLNGLRAFVPAEWERLTNGVGKAVIERYQREANHAESAVAVAAARRWVEYEQSVMAIGAPTAAVSAAVDEAALLARARVQLHYLANDCFLREGQLMHNASDVPAPTIVVQGRADMVCPPVTAYELSARLPSVRLRIIEQAGHAASEPRLAHALRVAADDMRHVLETAK